MPTGGSSIARRVSGGLLMERNWSPGSGATESRGLQHRRIHIYCIENKALHILLFLNKIQYPCARSLPPLNRGFDFIFTPYPALTHRAIELSPGLLNFRSPVRGSPPPYHAPLERGTPHFQHTKSNIQLPHGLFFTSGTAALYESPCQRAAAQ